MNFFSDITTIFIRTIGKGGAVLLPGGGGKHVGASAGQTPGDYGGGGHTLDIQIHTGSTSS